MKPQTATHTLALEIAQRQAHAASPRGYGRTRLAHAARLDKAMRA